MTKLYEILNRYTGKIIYSKECGSFRECVESAVKEGVSLSSADLCGANLRFANLRYAYLQNAYLCDADLRSADLQDANLRFANLRYAYLQDAYLCFANLRFANLRDAYLQDANLCDADLWNATGNGKEIITVQSSAYTINIIAPLKRVQIGCKNHSIKEWLSFSDDEIDKMDDGALEWWATYKPILIANLEALEMMEK